MRSKLSKKRGVFLTEKKEMYQISKPIVKLIAIYSSFQSNVEYDVNVKYLFFRFKGY